MTCVGGMTGVIAGGGVTSVVAGSVTSFRAGGGVTGVDGIAGGKSRSNCPSPSSPSKYPETFAHLIQTRVSLKQHAAATVIGMVTVGIDDIRGMIIRILDFGVTSSQITSCDCEYDE